MSNESQIIPTCSKCGGVHANDYDSFWEDGSGGKLCQMCWEAVADAEWWNRVMAMDASIEADKS